MPTWKKVLVSGSAAEVSQLNVGANQQITTAQSTTFLTGSFTGSFTGNGAGLTGVTATAIFPTTAKTDLATTDQIYINDGANKYITYGNLVTDLAGSGAGTSNLTTTDTGDSLALTSQIAVTGVSASFTGSLTGTASFATQAGNADLLDNQHGSYYQNASNINAGTIGNAYLPSAINVTSVTASFTGSHTGTLIGTASWATNATTAATATTATNATNTAITDTTTGTGPYYITFVDATTGNAAQRVDSTGLTYNATTNSITATASFAGTASFASTAPYSGLTGVPSGIVSASVLSSPNQGEVLLTTNGVAGSTIDLGLQTADSPTFAGLTISTNALAVNNTNGITTSQTTFPIVNTTATTINLGGAATAINLGASTGITTINHDARVRGALYVDGPITAISSSNLYIADQFILLASGSATAGDGGIMVDRGSDAAGNIAFGYDSTTDRWGFQDGLTDSTNTFDPTSQNGVSGSFVPYLFTEASHGATKPITGEFAVVGSQYMDNSGNFWIYTA